MKFIHTSDWHLGRIFHGVHLTGDQALDEVLKGPAPGENPEDYITVRLLDRVPVLNAMGRIRGIYPNALHIERPHFTAEDSPEETGARDHRKLGHAELFASFYSQVTGDELSEEQARVYVRIVDELNTREREALP